MTPLLGLRLMLAAGAGFCILLSTDAPFMAAGVFLMCLCMMPTVQDIHVHQPRAKSERLKRKVGG